MKRKHRSRSLVVLGVACCAALIITACEPANWEPGGSERPWYCDPTDTAINDGHAGGGGGHHSPYTELKGPLNGPDCLILNGMLDEAVDFASQFPTKGVAEANGWHWLAPWIAGQGTHHVNINAQVGTTFDGTRPNMLMYDGNGSSAELTGMVWAVQSGAEPPTGFPGANDHWHFHETLCYAPGPFIVGDGITDEQCEARGGVNQSGADTWLLHVWLPVYEGWQATDIFNRFHPTI